MATRDDDPHVPTPASGEPTPAPHGGEGLVPDDAQVSLIGNTPDGQTQQGAIRPAEGPPDHHG